VLGGLGVILFSTQALEAVVVRGAAGDAVQDLESFLVAAAQPSMIAAKLVYSGLMSVVGGYLAARVARTSPMAHGVFAAGLLAAANISGYATDEMARYTPVAARAALVVVMSGAVVAGAAVRARAAALEAEPAGHGTPAAGGAPPDSGEEHR